MLHAHHSDLEVVPKAEAPEAQKYAYYAPDPSPAPYTDTHKVAYHTNVHELEQGRTICGLQKRTFCIVAIVAMIAVVAVGGAVGGALATKSSSKNADAKDATAARPSPQSEAPISITPTPTSAESSTTITTTSIVGPSSTIFRDCPSSNGSLYDVTLGDTKMSFRKACEISYVNSNGIDSAYGKPVKSLNECIDLCAAFNINNRTQIAAGTSRICNAVCWRNTFDKINDWTGGMCFGFTSQNSSGMFRYKLPAETRCDSAALINQAY
jgi:hypothetical protein